MKSENRILNQFKGKRVLITGHTGFKGSWLSRILKQVGAEVCGYSLPAERESMFNICKNEKILTHVEGDIRNYEHLHRVIYDFSPEYVFHLAAQPLVSEGYNTPRETYETNLMGTVNVLECVRTIPGILGVLIVTTDKVYAEKEVSCSESDMLDGYDPYSNSKSCADLAASCYCRSFSMNNVSIVRAGNVIGGGDFAKNRLIPDCVRSFSLGQPVVLRHPEYVRPYQYVLDALLAYLKVASDCNRSGVYNIFCGEEASAQHTAELFAKCWEKGASVTVGQSSISHESSCLRLNAEKFKNEFGSIGRYGLENTLKKTAEWEKARLSGENMAEYTDKQIKTYFREIELF